MTPIIKPHIFTFNPKDNGGESLTLKTEFIHNGDLSGNNMYTIQELSLQSYGNSASFTISGHFSPEILRDLANQLESEKIKAQNYLSLRGLK